MFSKKNVKGNISVYFDLDQFFATPQIDFLEFQMRIGLFWDRIPVFSNTPKFFIVSYPKTNGTNKFSHIDSLIHD